MFFVLRQKFLKHRKSEESLFNIPVIVNRIEQVEWLELDSQRWSHWPSFLERMEESQNMQCLWSISYALKEIRQRSTLKTEIEQR